MPREDSHTVVLFEAQGFVWGTLQGEVSLGRLAAAYEAFRSHPHYAPGMDELVDLTRASIKKLTREQIETIRKYTVDTPEQHHNRSAVVVSSKLEYGLTRMMGISMELDVPAERFVCYSLREALEWLRPGQADELMAAHAQALREGSYV